MSTPPERIETDRLVLRRLRLADAPAIFERWAQDPEVTRWLVWRPHASVDEAVEHAENCEREWEDGTGHTWMIELREGDVGDAARPVGSIAAHPAGHRVALGYLLARDAWGRGYMREAVGALTRWLMEQPDVHRVWALCDVDNGASARVLEASGFELEGTLRRWMVHPNVSDEPRDVLCWSVVREASPG